MQASIGNHLLGRVVKTLLTLALGFFIFQVGVVFIQALPTRIWTIRSGMVMVAIGLAGVLLFGSLFLAIWDYDRLQSLARPVVRVRERLGWFRWPLAIAVAILPGYLTFYTFFGLSFSSPYIRYLVLAVGGLLFAVMVTQDEDHLLLPSSVIFGLVVSGSVFTIVKYLSQVTGFPFSLSWSEGNRFYDYSVYLGSSRYDYPGKLTIPYYSPGRYLLWGILFAIPQTPIWLHRLWDALLWLVPYILLGFAIARWTSLRRMVKWTLVLWLFIFLIQGPVYPTLVLSAILVAFMVRPERRSLTLIGVAAAGFYASWSRWTWAPAPAIWAIIILLEGVDIRSGLEWKPVLRKLLWIALVAVTGLAFGVLANPESLIRADYASSTAFKQPLLWYRLFPNATYPDGILVNLVIAVGPLLLLLIWLALTRRWVMSWLQALAYLGAAVVTLAVGLVASVKIGGGNNLHNMDMFLVTLAFLTGLMLRASKPFQPASFPGWVQALLVVVLLMPTWRAIRFGSPLELLAPDKVITQLDTIREVVDEAQSRGEVLFMDQRQLLTFGYIQDVPLVSDYEKKYLMDKAMANDREYLDGFYADLRDQRFTLIISDPLFEVEKGQQDSFGDENNAWVERIARPVLCYYKPDVVLKEVHVQLLVPRENQEDCHY